MSNRRPARLYERHGARVAEFTTTGELLAIPWVAEYKERAAFYRYELRSYGTGDYALTAVYETPEECRIEFIGDFHVSSGHPRNIHIAIIGTRWQRMLKAVRKHLSEPFLGYDILDGDTNTELHSGHVMRRRDLYGAVLLILLIWWSIKHW